MASTVNVHMLKLIEQLKEQGILREGGRILGSTDGCAKQYKCSTAIHFMSLLSFQHNLVIDRAIGCPGHGELFIEPFSVYALELKIY